MPELFQYILKANAALLVFYLTYRLWLRKLTFYRLNRYFLLFGLLFSMLYPFIDISALLGSQANLQIELITLIPAWESIPEPAGTEQASQAFSYWQLLSYAYWGGVLVMSALLCVQFLSLYNIHRKSRPAKHADNWFRQTSEAVNPFSFWQSIYLNPERHSASEMETIFRHEQQHVQGWHTLDILLARLCHLVCWFNPAAWLLQHAVAENLEFVADQQTLKSGIDQKQYQYSLLRMGTQTQLPTLVNNFNFIPLKTRIAMMNQQNSSKTHLLKYILLTPMLTALLLAGTMALAQSTNSNRITLVSGEQQSVTVHNSSDSGQDSIIYFVDGKEVNEAEAKAMNPEEIASMQVLKGENAISFLDNSAAKGAIIITTKARENSPEVEAFNKRIEEVTPKTNNDRKLRIVTSPELETELKDALILLDGEEISYEVMQNLNSNRIEKVEILKGDKALDTYGQKGQNGVIIITTKD